MSNIDRSTFGHDTTTDEVLEGIDLTGKLALVTKDGTLGGHQRPPTHRVRRS